MQLESSVKTITLQRLAELIDNHECVSLEIAGIGVIHNFKLEDKTYSVLPTPDDNMFYFVET